MKWISAFLLMFVCLISVAFGQDVVAPLPTEDFLAFLLESIGGIKGAGAYGVAVIVVQVLLKFFETKWGELIGKWKLLAVTGLTLVATVLTSMMDGGSLIPSLLGGAGLSALQVFVNQIIKQFFEKND